MDSAALAGDDKTIQNGISQSPARESIGHA
jgi:hypothetical protein